MHTRWLIPVGALLLALFTLVPSNVEAQRLRRASRTVRGERSQPSSRRSSRSSTRRSRPAPMIVSARRWAPLIVRGPYVVPLEDDDAEPVEPFLHITVAAEGQYALDDIGHAALMVRVGLAWPIELHAAYGIYVEPLARGAEMLGLGRLGVAWRIVQLPEVQARVGLALRHVHDRAGGIAGIEGFGGVDLMPAEPFVISIDGGAGVVGEAWVLVARATVGLVAGPVEVYSGWEHVAFEPLDRELGDGTWLSGPVLGLRGWL